MDQFPPSKSNVSDVRLWPLHWSFNNNTLTSHSHQSNSLNDRCSIKNDRQPLFSIPLCPQPFEGPFPTLVLSIFIHYLSIFFLSAFPSPSLHRACRIIFASPVDLVMCLYHLNLSFLTVVIRSADDSIA